MPTAIEEPDIEQGVLTSEIFAEWNFDESRLSVASNYIAGLLVILFLAGVLPLSLLFLTSVLLVCLSTCLRAHVEHRVNRNLSNAQGLGSIRSVIQVLSDAGTSRGMNLTSLQLSLVQRDFNEADYDTLLALDVEVVRSKQGQISSKHLKTLTTYKHPARSECNHCPSADSEGMCAVCLDSFEENNSVTRLACQHSFHSECIRPWLAQQGLSAQCPLCKAQVWPRDRSAPQKNSVDIEGPALATAI